jgi:error-prone DNA polymerase
MYLNAHSHFSFKYGTLSIEKLLKEASSLGIGTLALTDINNTSGCADFVRTAGRYGIKPVIGIDFRTGVTRKFIGIARNNEGFYELNVFLSSVLAGKDEISEQAPCFPNAYVVYPFSREERPLRENEFVGIRPSELNKLPFSSWKYSLHKLVVLQPVTFSNKAGFNTHRLLRAIGNNTLLSKLPLSEQAEETELLFNEKQLENAYSFYPLIPENTRRLLNDCQVDFEFGQSKNKQVFGESPEKDNEELRTLTYKGLLERYGALNPALIQRAEKELGLITRQGFGAYFLINHDIVQYARRKNYFYVGRGSGANSIVAYCLGITDVDPVDLDLYFERFINEHRTNPPDFDIDFSWKDRDDIISYVFNRYGEKHTCLLGTYSTFQSSAVIRELGKVFGLPKPEIDELVENRKHRATPDHIAALIHKYGKLMVDIPSHLSIHAGGILISEKPIRYYTATSLPPKGFPLSQFSMVEAEDMGLYKFDILSQRGLGHIRETIEIVRRNKGEDIDIHDIKAFKEDPEIRKLLKSGKAMGCFYVESPAMRMLLKKLKAETYLDLVAASSIIRPGVAQSGMMREYILRFRDPSRRDYIHPIMKELMEETFGIMVYQEDVIRVAHHFAGLTLAEADVLRRGMSGKFRAREEFQKAKSRFLEGSREKGHSDSVSREVWRQIESFAGYSFSKGHSASYAVESYQSLFLKAYYPREFMVGVINNFGGFYKTEFYVHEARMSGAKVNAPCVNRSGYMTCIYGDDIYLGFIHMGGLEEKTGNRIPEEREKNGTFRDLADFCRRVPVTLEQLQLLIRIGAFRFTGSPKKKLLWEMFSILGNNKKTRPGAELFEAPRKNYKLPPLHSTPYDDALDELEILGFPLSSPFHLLKDPPENSILTDNLLEHVGKKVEITGYLVCTKLTRTRNNQDMFFGTFLDSRGVFFDTTHFPPAALKYPFRGRGCYRLTGKVVEEFEYPSIEIETMEKLNYISL